MDDQTILRRNPLSDRQKRLMLSVLIRKAGAFEVAKTQLRAEHFSEVEKIYKLVWQTVLDFYESYEELPAVEELLGELQARLEEVDSAYLSPEQVEDLDRFIGVAYDMPAKSLKERVALRYLQRFLEDDLAIKAREAFAVSEATPQSMHDLIQSFSSVAIDIQNLQDTPVDEPFPVGWNKVPPVLKKSTMFGWLDEFLNGGDAVNEVIAVVGPFGSCKTLLATQLSTRAARTAHADFREAKSSGGEAVLKLSYHVTYEEPVELLRVRALSYIGMIDRKYLESGNPDELSTVAHSREYERVQFKDKAICCELQRWKDAQRWLNRNWRVIDFTGFGEGREHLGQNDVAEIVAAIKSDLARFSRKIGIRCEVEKIIIDYAGLAVKRLLESKNLNDDDHLRHHLAKYPGKAKRLLAARFKCPVYVFHQLSGAANALSPGVMPKKTDIAECKMFLENADFGIVIGNPLPDGLCSVSLQKARRAKNIKNIVVRINGALCRLEDTCGEWVLYERGRTIISREDLERINGGTGGVSGMSPASRRLNIVREHQAAISDT
jgi:hypothetical protein